MTLAALVFAVGLALAGGKPPSGGRPTRGAVEAKLKAYEPRAAESLGPGADEALVEIGRDPKVEVLVRARAVAALGYFPTPAARRFLEQTVESKATATDPGERLILRRAAVALGWLGGASVPARLGALLDHGDPEVRLDAVIGLGLTRLPAAADLLRKRLDSEQVARVRAQMGRQLRVIEDALAAAPPK